MEQAANLTADHVLRLFGDVEPAARQGPLLSQSVYDQIKNLVAVKP
jgi:hypothetical protein